MHMRMKVHHVPEGLNEEDQPGPRARTSRGVCLIQQPRGDAAQFPQPGAPAPEDRAQDKPRGGEPGIY